MSIIQKLTEGIVSRSVRKEGEALLDKWERTGLLEGLTRDREKENMARLLENQAKQLLKEVNTMQSGAVEGFAAVAFPIVRRVFAGLIANDIVSVQPMSLPSGLIFFLDFTFGDTKDNVGAADGDSIFGGGVVGHQIATQGVTLDTDTVEKSFYSLNGGYASPTGTVDISWQTDGSTLGDNEACYVGWADGVAVVAGKVGNTITEALDQQDVRFDADVLDDGTNLYRLAQIQLDQTTYDQLNLDNIIAMQFDTTDAELTGALLVRRLTSQGLHNSSSVGAAARSFGLVLRSDAAGDFPSASATLPLIFAYKDAWTAGNGLGSVAGTADWPLESGLSCDPCAGQAIPEIDIRVDSLAVTAVTKKLKAKWTPELGQDLDAYHNLDAEVELTSILSEQIGLEIDQEILNDLVQGATADTYYWSRSPGKFVVRTTGVPIDSDPTTLNSYPDFTGTVSEWYETLAETINDVSAQIHRKTLRGGANFVVCSPEVANILEFTAGFRANVTADADTGNIGAVNVGSLSKKFDLLVDPYFPRNVILVGRRGSSFLESGYVYAPYVPLQVTPTIFGIEDFTPRKGVMTRYGKQMVRPDMYGLVIVTDLLGGVPV